jgi:hypothetical protein
MTKLHVLASTSLVAIAAVTLSGCELTSKSTKRFEGDPVDQTVNWTSGTDLQIDARNGIIHLERGASDVVRVTFYPFTYRGYDEEGAATIEMDESLTKTAELSEDGNAVEVVALKEGEGSSSLGADLVIEVPPEFDAGIFISQGNGDVDINSVGEAIQLVVVNDGTGNCHVDGSPTVVSTQVWCDGVEVNNVSDYVDIQADGLAGNASVHLAYLGGPMPSGVNKSTIYTNDGDIVLDVPYADEPMIDAQAFGDGSVVNAGDDVPEGCDVNENAANNKVINCGGGSLLELRSGLDDLGSGNIEIRYH